jgi:cellobiose PTS system EIIC component
MNTNFIEDKLLPVAGRIQANKYINAISRGFMSLTAITMIGAIFTLLKTFPLGEGYTNFLASTGLDKILNIPVSVTTELMGMFVAFSIAFQLAKSFKRDAFAVGFISLISFFVVTPFSTTAADSAGNPIVVENVIPKLWMGAQGIFTAMIVGILVAKIYDFVISKNWRIKLPDGVPPMVAEPFEAIIPAFIIVTIFLIARAGFEVTPFENVHQFIYGLIQVPLSKVGNSFVAYIVIILVAQILWFFGIHGSNVTGAVMMTFWMTAATENAIALANGQPIPNMLTMNFYLLMTLMLGGSGNTIGLSFLMAFRSKSKRYKTLGKLGGIPNIFNITEPIIFGFPIVMNPAMIIPWVFTPLITFILGYVLMNLNIVGIPAILPPWTTPFFVNGFLVGAGISFGILMLLSSIISVICYYPFFKAADNKAFEEENIEAKEV